MYVYHMYYMYIISIDIDYDTACKINGSHPDDKVDEKL